MVNLEELFSHHILDRTYSVLPIGPLQIPVTKHTIFLLLISLGVTLLVIFAGRRAAQIPKGIYSLVELYVIFVRDSIVVPNIGHGGVRYLKYFLTLFIFILASNFAGLIPGSATVTSNAAVTSLLALCTLALINFAGIRERGLWGYLKSFVPAGIPALMVPLIFSLEILGLLIRCVVLAVRLFANMIAGHTVILLFFSLIFLIGSFFVAPVSMGIVIFIMFIEVMIAFLQAYIFTMLSAIFVGLVVHSH